MRELKFRCWDPTEKKMWSPCIDTDGRPCRELPFLLQRVDGEIPTEVMQFTGIRDKHGKEIYEGDIVTWYDEEWGGSVVNPIYGKMEVKWKGAGFNIKDEPNRYTVIGNAFQNPELMEGK